MQRVAIQDTVQHPPREGKGWRRIEGGEWRGGAELGMGTGMGMEMRMGEREAHDTCNTCRHTIGGKRYQWHPSPALDTHCIELLP